MRSGKLGLITLKNLSSHLQWMEGVNYPTCVGKTSADDVAGLMLVLAAADAVAPACLFFLITSNTSSRVFTK